ncbi:MAG: T9SS type A sorting domain-containing protein, partial [Altibacter sp.]|uniref:T9SS type A sorting domain-containing protein n=1 Tax=Altibacter sp. TaxID=2024823 RepID=UPI001DF7E2E5
APFNDGNGANSGKVVVLQNDDILQASDYISNGTALYPNPNRNSFSIYFQNNPQNVTISIVDVAGKRVYSEIFTAQENISIDHNLDAGIYFVKLTSNTSEATLKMVVE